MILGHTPVDSAFTVYGLLGAGAVLRMILSFPVISLVFVLALFGLYRAIALSAAAETSSPFWSYVVVTVSTFLFFTHRAPLTVTDVTTAAEAAGAVVRRTTQQAFPAGAASSGETSFGLMLIVRAINGIMFGATKLVNEDFLSAPMAVARGITSAMEWDFGYPPLHEEMTQFKRKCYDPAVTRYVRGQATLAQAEGKPFDINALDFDKIWPGSPDLEPYYDRVNSAGIDVTGGKEKSCLDWWRSIREQAIQYELPRLKAQIGPMRQIKTRVGAALAGKDTDDEYVKLMTRRFLRDPLTSQEISDERTAKGLGLRQAGAGAVASLANRFTLGTRALMVTAYGGYVQGGAMAILLYTFPLAVSFVLLPGWGHYLVNYFLVFAWLRSWTVGWAVVDKVTDIVGAVTAVTDRSFAETVLQMGSLVPLMSSVLYLVVPFVLGILIGGGAAALAALLGFSGIGLGSVARFATRMAGMFTGRAG